MATRIERDDIQGIVVAGYGHLPAACFVLLRGEPGGQGRAPAANAWLRGLAVTTASGRAEEHATQVAFTHHGLRALGLAPGTADALAVEFVDGMATPNRSRALGDTGTSAPEHWSWGGPHTLAIDVVLMLYAKDRDALQRQYEAHAADFTRGGLVEVQRLGAADLGATESFGFADGISQPLIDGLGPAGRSADTVKAGEFLLGYPNEYGQYPGTALVPSDDDPAGVLARGPGKQRRDFGRNGTYLVYRELGQDVDGFLAFLDAATRRADGTSDREAAMRLAAKIVGRWPSGAPLVLAPDADDPSLARANDFGYFNEDREGLRCPIGAHIRRANPRDSLPPKPGSDDSIAVNKRHRILRRGRQRDPAPSEPGAVSGPGLHFICMNANIARQFEFIQGTWCDNPKFEGLYEDRDPLVTTSPGQSFRVPGLPVRTRYTGLPSFISVIGGAYFFLPSLRAIRYLGHLHT